MLFSPGTNWRRSRYRLVGKLSKYPTSGYVNMVSIVDRLLIREVLKTLLAVGGVLLLVLASNQLVRYLADAAVGNISADVVFLLLGLKALGYLGLLLVPSFFIGVLLALGRMHKDSEVVALCALGFGPSRLYRGILLLAIPVTLAVGVLSYYAMPWGTAQAERIKWQQEQSTEVRGISPGRFNEIRRGEYIFYIEALLDDDKTMENIFIRGGQPGADALITASSAYQYVDPRSGDRFLVLEDGYRYEGSPGTADYRIAEFERFGIRIRQRQRDAVIDRRKAQPSRVLLESESLADRAELQWRLSIPASVPLLALLAVPLSRSLPRQGRYAKLAIAVLIYVIYSNLLGMAKSWMMREDLPAWLGLWWVHVLMLAIVGIVLLRRIGVRWAFMLISGKAPRA